jgi:hypothetical protein
MPHGDNRRCQEKAKGTAEGSVTLALPPIDSALGYRKYLVVPGRYLLAGGFMSAGYSRRKFYGHGLSKAIALLCINPNLLTRLEPSEHEI